MFWIALGTLFFHWSFDTGGKWNCNYLFHGVVVLFKLLFFETLIGLNMIFFHFLSYYKCGCAHEILANDVISVTVVLDKVYQLYGSVRLVGKCRVLTGDHMIVYWSYVKGVVFCHFYVFFVFILGCVCQYFKDVVLKALLWNIPNITIRGGTTSSSCEIFLLRGVVFHIRIGTLNRDSRSVNFVGSRAYRI